MSAALQQGPMSVTAFLAWEERQPVRYEFDGVQPVAMAGQRYILVEQDRIGATIYQRAGADWIGRPLIGAEAALSLPDVGIAAIRLGDLYEGVEFALADGAA